MTNDEIWLYKKAQEGGGGGGGTSILSGTTDPVSSQGNNGQIFLKYSDSQASGDYVFDSELGWSCNDDYYVHDTTQLMSTHSTAFYKTEAGGAIAVEYHYSGFYGPILISTDIDYVKYTENTSPVNSATIDGVVWYISTSNYWNGWEDANATIPLYTTDAAPFTNVENTIRNILEISGYMDGDFSGGISSAYLKVDNTWQSLIGSQIDDVGNTTETDVPIDMNSISFFKEGSMSVLSDDDTVIVSCSGANIGFTAFYSTPIDVTDISKLKYELKTRNCYGDGAQAQQASWYIQIGLMTNAPATIINAEYSQAGFVAGNYFANSNTDYGTQEIDVSSLSGNYYFVINAHGWNASIKNLRSE